MKIRRLLCVLALCATLSALWSCSKDNNDTPDEPNKPDDTENPVAPPFESTGFAKGADVSWLTELEAKGYKFYSPEGKQMECLALLRDYCGVNSIRLRVWVNPKGGYNSKADVIAKAKRVKQLGMRLMIDFHFSDTWADPGQQATPDAWKDLDIEGLKKAVTEHVLDVMNALKAEDITPSWAQIGNETADGFMYPLGNIGKHPKNFAELVTVGTKAVKTVFPDCLTIVHTDSGDNEWRYDYVFGTLKRNNAEYDMIGVSFYPEVKTWKASADKLLTNLKNAKKTYGKPTMVCEIGLQAREIKASTEMMQYVYDGCQNGVSEGLFYWEPEAPIGFNGGYDKGCFIDGKPTTALDCFK